MNLNKIFEEQTKLDTAIQQAHNYDVKEIQDRRVLALLIEVAELANEIQAFKYWKKNIKVDKEKVLEEYADGVHFLTSIALYNNVEAKDIKAVVTNPDLNLAFINLFQAIMDMQKNMTKENIIEAYEEFIGIALIMKFTEQEIVDSYIRKNRINYERIKNNY